MDAGYDEFCEDFGVEGGLWTVANLVEFLNTDEDEQPPTGTCAPPGMAAELCSLVMPLTFARRAVPEGAENGWGWDDNNEAVAEAAEVANMTHLADESGWDGQSTAYVTEAVPAAEPVHVSPGTAAPESSSAAGASESLGAADEPGPMPLTTAPEDVKSDTFEPEPETAAGENARIAQKLAERKAATVASGDLTPPSSPNVPPQPQPQSRITPARQEEDVQKISALQQQIQDMQVSADKLEDRAAKAERKVLALQKERDMMRRTAESSGDLEYQLRAKEEQVPSCNLHN